MADDGKAIRSKAPVGPVPPALLKIAPAVLYYAPPYNRVIMNSITLQNLTGNYVAYKVKTTAPKRYCVRPNTGVIAPQSTIEVQVHLTAFNEAEIQKEKDRFQIQSVDLSSASAELPAESKDVWRTVSDSQIIKQRIKVKFANAPAGKSPSVTSSSSSPPSSSEVAPTIRHVQNKPDNDASFLTTTSTSVPTSTSSSSTTPALMEAKQSASRSVTQESKSSPALVEELQDKLRRVVAEKDKLAKDLETLQSQNRRLLTQEQSRTGGFFDFKLIVLALIFLLLGYYFGSPGNAASSVPIPPSTTTIE